MKQQGGVSHMEVVMIAVAVFALGVIAVNKFILEPEEKAEVTAEDRLKIQINALENKIKAYEGIESRFQALEKAQKEMQDSLDHTQNLAENGENFMKANEQEIKNLKKLNETIQNGYIKMAQRLDHAEANLKKTPEIIKVQLEEWKKPLVAQIQQTRAQRPVVVNWKKYRAENGKLHWAMTDKTVEYSRAEYLRKLKKQEKKSAKQ